MKIRIVIVILVSVMFSGCGCIGVFSHQLPNNYQNLESSIIVNESKEIVWQKLIVGLEESSFDINNMERDLGFINVSYNGDPCEYIDCGINSVKLYQFPTGDLSTRTPGCTEWSNNHNIYARKIHRTMSLEGKAKIVLDVLESYKTMVSVDVRYIITRSRSGQGIDSQEGQVMTNFVSGQQVDKISFNSGDYVRLPEEGSCTSNGEFEKEILDLVR